MQNSKQKVERKVDALTDLYYLTITLIAKSSL